MQAGTGKRQLVNEINITPLTDVFLVLLIIMMLLQTSATLRYAGQIRPPEVNGADRVKQAEENCIIEITGKGPNGEAEKISIDKQELTDFTTELETILRARASGAEKAKLLLRADKDASSDAVMSVIEIIQAAAADETLPTSQRTFLGNLTISVESLANAGVAADTPIDPAAAPAAPSAPAAEPAS